MPQTNESVGSQQAPLPNKLRLPSLDGWRALSVLLVLGGHSEHVYRGPERWKSIFPWFDGGVGVLFFFVISGFLITWLMIMERERTGRISLKHFYIRRALRILPVYFAFLLAGAALQYFTSFSQDRTTWFGNLTFTRNFVGGPHTTGHLWSLSVEEQFYLLWPGIFVVLLNSGASHRKLLGILALPIAVAPICRLIGYTTYPSLPALVLGGRSFFSYFDCLAVGCACAVILSKLQRMDARDITCLWTRYRVFALGCAMVLVPYVLEKFQASSAILRGLRLTIFQTSEAIGFSVLMLQSVFMPHWGIYRVLNWPWVARIGVLSYSIYIWQQIFCTEPEVFGLPQVWWWSFPFWLVTVFVVAWISYYGLEQPVLRLRDRFRDGRHSPTP